MEDRRQAHQLLVEMVSDRGDHGSDHSEDPDRPETVQAMQVAMHIPKPERPLRTDVIEASARAVLEVCLSPEVARNDLWREHLSQWYGHRIRKVTRRARGVAWKRVQNIPGVTVGNGTAQARAFLPTAVSEVPAEIRKLQIKGTELDADQPGSPQPDHPVLYLDAGLAMTVGKSAAQAGHAAQLLAAASSFEWVSQWADAGFPLSAREVSTARFRELCTGADATAVQDAGYTEVAPGAITALALPAPQV